MKRDSASRREIGGRLKDNRAAIIAERRIQIERVFRRVRQPRQRRKRMRTFRSRNAYGDEKKSGDEETGCETKHREVAPYLYFLRILHVIEKISRKFLERRRVHRTERGSAGSNSIR